MIKIQTVIYITRRNTQQEEVELEIEVSGNMTEYVPAKTSGPYENCSPAEGGEIEVIDAKCTDKENSHLFVELTPQEKFQAIEALQEASYDTDKLDEDEYDDFNYGDEN